MDQFPPTLSIRLREIVQLTKAPSAEEWRGLRVVAGKAYYRAMPTDRYTTHLGWIAGRGGNTLNRASGPSRHIGVGKLYKIVN